MDDIDNNMKQVENFMEKYQPLRFLEIMVEGMQLVLGRKKVVRLLEYKDAKHKELVEIIATDDGAPMNMKKMGPQDFVRYVQN